MKKNNPSQQPSLWDTLPDNASVGTKENEPHKIGTGTGKTVDSTHMPGSLWCRKMTRHSGRKIWGIRKEGPIAFVQDCLLQSDNWSSQVCWLTWKLQHTEEGYAYPQLFPTTAKVSAASASSLWPTPKESTNKNGMGIAPSYLDGTHGWTLGAAVTDSQAEEPNKLWPTPQAHHSGGQGTPIWNDLERMADGHTTRISGTPMQKRLENEVYVSEMKAQGLWPTPKSGSNRNSRQAITDAKGGGKHKSDLSLAQAVEVVSGVLPRELEDAEELPPQWRKLWPTPRTPTGGRKVEIREDGYHGNLEEALAEDDPTLIGEHLNPTWVESIMGFPKNWTEILS